MTPSSTLSAPLAVALACLVAASCASSRMEARAPANVDLSGTWILDRDASDRFATVMATRSRGTRRGGGGGAGGGGRVMTGGGGGGGRVMSREAVEGSMRALAEPPDRFTIAQADTVVAMEYPDDLTMNFSTTGATVPHAWLDGMEIDVKAGWRGDALQVERSRDDVTATDVYRREGHSLVVETTLRGGMGGDLVLLRYYHLEGS